MSGDDVAWQERLDALQALIFAPFIIFIIVAVIVAVALTAYIERGSRR